MQSTNNFFDGTIKKSSQSRSLSSSSSKDVTMKFAFATTVISAALLAAISPSEAFARPSFGLSKTVNHAAVQSIMARGGASSSSGSSLNMSTESATSEVISVPTTPIEGMAPGTSGLRKKVEVWQGEHYVENFIQSLIDTAVDSNGGKMLDTIVVAGDGRYYNNEAIQTIARLLAANGIRNIWIPQGG